MLTAPGIKLGGLRRHDNRLAAHLDGVAVAGSEKNAFCEEALQRGNVGATFVATVEALQDGDDGLYRRAVRSCDEDGTRRGEFLAGFGWIEPRHLRGVVQGLLSSRNACERTAAIAACAMHRVDPGLGDARRLDDPDALARARAYRAAGELGKRALVSTLAGCASAEHDAACRFWAAWSSVLLGDREQCLGDLVASSLRDGLFKHRAFELALAAMSPAVAREHLRHLARDASQLRWLLIGAGITGDPSYVPWILSHMDDDDLKRRAGEAFSLITGVDLYHAPYEEGRPVHRELGPMDDPKDDNVAIDEDEGLPWFDVERLKAWWHVHSSRFRMGVRYFGGVPLTRESCLGLLSHGYQRQRILAALHLSLLNPGTPLFEWRAPAWRQQRQLAGMS